MNKPIPGTNGNYHIYDDGRVYSVLRQTKEVQTPMGLTRRTVGGYFLQPYTKHGRAYIDLSVDGKVSHRRVDHLYADAYGLVLPVREPTPYVSRFPREPGFDGYDVWETVPGPDSVDMGADTWN